MNDLLDTHKSGSTHTMQTYIACLFDNKAQQRLVYLTAESLEDAAERTQASIRIVLPDVTFKPFWSNESHHPTMPGWWIQSDPSDFDRRVMVYQTSENYLAN